MKVSVEKGKIYFEWQELLEHLSPDELRELVDSLSCENQIIEDVSAQLLDGWTELGSHGSRGFAETKHFSPLEKARRELAMRAGDTAKDEIDELIRGLIYAESRADKYREWGYGLRSILERLQEQGLYKGVIPWVDLASDYSMKRFEIVRKDISEMSGNPG